MIMVPVCGCNSHSSLLRCCSLKAERRKTIAQLLSENECVSDYIALGAVCGVFDSTQHRFNKLVLFYQSEDWKGNESW